MQGSVLTTVRVKEVGPQHGRTARGQLILTRNKNRKNYGVKIDSVIFKTAYQKAPLFFAQTDVTKSHIQSGLNNRNVFPPSSEGQKFKIRVPA